MSTDPILDKAIRLARSRKYDAALKILEPETDRYTGSFRYCYLMAVVSLYSGDFGGALTNFRQAREIKMQDANVLLGLAALYLRRGETGKALDFYLDILEADPGNRIAKRAMTVIRKNSGKDSFNYWLERGRLPSLYPPIPLPAITPGQMVLPGILLAVILALAYGILVKFNVFQNPFGRSKRADPEFSLTREERGEPVQLGGVYQYILTRDQAVDTYDRALKLFTDYRDEAAKINLNRILESNASEAIKNKARLLMGFMDIPGFDNFRRGDNVAYSEVVKEPLAYRDVHIIWSGMATNVEMTDNLTTFDFLVGYDTRSALEGIVSVTFNQAVSVNPQRPLELLGKIIPINSSAIIKLEGIAIHQPVGNN
jgi:tetratricopeptide (TPR) repeat protein